MTSEATQGSRLEQARHNVYDAIAWNHDLYDDDDPGWPHAKDVAVALAELEAAARAEAEAERDRAQQENVRLRESVNAMMNAALNNDVRTVMALGRYALAEDGGEQ